MPQRSLEILQDSSGCKVECDGGGHVIREENSEGTKYPGHHFHKGSLLGGHVGDRTLEKKEVLALQLPFVMGTAKKLKGGGVCCTMFTYQPAGRNSP